MSFSHLRDSALCDESWFVIMVAYICRLHQSNWKILVFVSAVAIWLKSLLFISAIFDLQPGPGVQFSKRAAWDYNSKCRHTWDLNRSLLLRLNGFGTRGNFHHVMGRGPQQYLLRMWLNAIESQREVLQSFRAHSDLLIRIQNLYKQKATIKTHKIIIKKKKNMYFSGTPHLVSFASKKALIR